MKKSRLCLIFGSDCTQLVIKHVGCFYGHQSAKNNWSCTWHSNMHLRQWRSSCFGPHIQKRKPKCRSSRNRGCYSVQLSIQRCPKYYHRSSCTIGSRTWSTRLRNVPYHARKMPLSKDHTRQKWAKLRPLRLNLQELPLWTFSWQPHMRVDLQNIESLKSRWTHSLNHSLQFVIQKVSFRGVRWSELQKESTNRRLTQSGAIRCKIPSCLLGSFLTN